jgi:hypothetical protein
MTPRAVFKPAAWLALAAPTLAGLYWLFLNTPESNALTLALSAALMLAIIIAGAIAVNTSVLLAAGGGWASSIRAAMRGIPWFVVAAIPVVVTWIVITRADSWILRHNGELSAWFIARFGWADISLLFQAATWLSRWIRWVAVPVAALCLLAALLQRGSGALSRTVWLRHAWHWRTLVLASIVFIVFLALPWRLTAWRPELPATWVQPAVAGLRLATVFVLGLMGCSLLVTLAIPARPTPPQWGEPEAGTSVPRPV